MDASDAGLLGRFVKDGDEEAFEALVRRHGPMVLGVCRRVLNDPHGAQDACQAVFLVLAQKAASLRRRASLSSWLYGVAVRVARKAKARAAERTRHERRAAEMAARKKAERARREEEEAWRALRPVLDEEMLRLPEKYRAPLVLCCLQGRTQEEAAGELGWTKGTVSGRIARARELLRGRLARRGAVLSAGLLASAISKQAAAVELPGSFAAATAKTASLMALGRAAGAVSEEVAALTKGAMKMLFMMKVKTAAVFLSVALLSGGAGVGAAAWRAQREGPATVPVQEAAERIPSAKTDRTPLRETSSVPEAPAQKTIVPRTCRLQDVGFVTRLRRLGVYLLFCGHVGRLSRPGPPVPAELRFKKLKVKDLLEETAARSGWQVLWLKGGQVAVLQRGLAEEKRKVLAAQLQSNKAAVRREAAWAAGWVDDVRVVPLLLDAVQRDPALAETVQSSLRRLGWLVAELYDARAWPLLERDLSEWGRPLSADNLLADLAQMGDENARKRCLKDAKARARRLKKDLTAENVHTRLAAAAALGRMGREEGWATLEKALADKDFVVRRMAVRVLGETGGEKALALLEKALADKNTHVRGEAVFALGQVGGEKVLAQVEKALDDEDVNVRKRAVGALWLVGNAKAQALLEKVLINEASEAVREAAAFLLGKMGRSKGWALFERKVLTHREAGLRAMTASILWQMDGERALPLLEKALADESWWVREKVARALGEMYGAKALALLEKAMADKNAQVRASAVFALKMGGAKALALLRKALADKDVAVRTNAVLALEIIGGEEARALLKTALDDKDTFVRSSATNALGSIGGEEALALLEKALDDENANVRMSAAGALGRLLARKRAGSKEARETRGILLAALAGEKDREPLSALIQALQSAANNPQVKKALVKAQARLNAMPPPHPNAVKPPAPPPEANEEF